MPIPPPTHIDSRPNVPFVLRRPLISVPVIRAPVMPNGWPTAMAQPIADREVLLGTVRSSFAGRVNLGGRRAALGAPEHRALIGCAGSRN